MATYDERAFYPAAAGSSGYSRYRQGYNHKDSTSSSRMGAVCGRGQVVDQHDLEWTPSMPREPSSCSVATLQNARYCLDHMPSSDHPNEDRHFSLEGGNFQALGVFDGHDGPRAAGFASNFLLELFNTTSWKKVAQSGHEHIPQALSEFFRATETEFFRSIRSSIREKEALQAVIPSVRRFE